MKLSKASIIPALFGFLALHSPDAGAGQADASIYMPNNHGKSITTPVAVSYTHLTLPTNREV